VSKELPFLHLPLFNFKQALHSPHLAAHEEPSPSQTPHASSTSPEFATPSQPCTAIEKDLVIELCRTQ